MNHRDDDRGDRSEQRSGERAQSADRGAPARQRGPGERARRAEAPEGGEVPVVGVTRAPAAPDLAVLAALVAAADQLCAPALPAVPDPRAAGADHRAWRFSGRWWAKPTVLRRDRPATLR